MSSFLSVANQLSATALSQHCRGRERLWRIAWSASSAVKSRAVYCEPRSVWEDQPRRRPSRCDGHAQRVTDQRSAHVVGHRPADHATAGEIDHRSQVQPALPGADVRDVAAPRLIELERGRSEVPLQQVHGRGPGLRVGDGGALEAPPAASSQAVLAH